MNQIDRENLQFILSTTGPALEIWYNNLTPEQRIYASNLLEVYKKELSVRLILIEDPIITDFTECNQILDRIRK